MAAPEAAAPQDVLSRLPADVQPHFQNRGQIRWAGSVSKLNHKWTDEKAKEKGDERLVVITNEGLFVLKGKVMKRCVAIDKLSLVETPGRFEELAAFRVGFRREVAAGAAATADAGKDAPADEEHGLILRLEPAPLTPAEKTAGAKVGRDRRADFVSAAKRAHNTKTRTEMLVHTLPSTRLCSFVNRTRAKGWKNDPDLGTVASGPPAGEVEESQLPPPPDPPVAGGADAPPAPTSPTDEKPPPPPPAGLTPPDAGLQPGPLDFEQVVDDGFSGAEPPPQQDMGVGQDMMFQSSMKVTSPTHGGRGGALASHHSHGASPGAHLHSVQFDIPGPIHESVTQYPLTMGRGRGGNMGRGGLAPGVHPGELRRNGAQLISPQRPLQHMGYDIGSPGGHRPAPPQQHLPMWAPHHPAAGPTPYAGDATPLPPGPQGVYPSANPYNRPPQPQPQLQLQSAARVDVGDAWRGAGTAMHTSHPYTAGAAPLSPTSPAVGAGAYSPPLNGGGGYGRGSVGGPAFVPDYSHLQGAHPQYAPPPPPGYPQPARDSVVLV